MTEAAQTPSETTGLADGWREILRQVQGGWRPSRQARGLLMLAVALEVRQEPGGLTPPKQVLYELFHAMETMHWAD